MDKAGQNAMWEFMNLFRGYVSTEAFATASLLVVETKEECKAKSGRLSSERVYEVMLGVADRFDVRNPFKDSEQFFKVYQAVPEQIDWDVLLEEGMRSSRFACISDALFEEYSKRFKIEAFTVLIAEGDKYIPNLKKLVDDHAGCKFTITCENRAIAQAIRRIFNGYENVEVLETSIYRYGFVNNRYDLIFSAPHFGVRNLAEDQTFICREYDMVALENLLLHTNAGGELIITMPARITFASGKVSDLRQFVQQMYRIKEISELPEGTFKNTGIKTYLLDLENSRQGDEDVIIRRYKAGDRKTRRTTVAEILKDDETFVMLSELEDQGDWNIDKIFALQDEEWIKFQGNSIRKVSLGEVAEIFRGKSVTKKDETGNIGVVNISNIGEYDVVYERLDHLDEDERKVANYILREGDLLIPARGTAIRTAIFHDQKYLCIASSNIIVIRPDSKVLHSTYLKIFLDSPLGEKMISGVQQGTVIMNISYNDLKLLKIPLPPIEKQQQLADEYSKELQIYKDSIASAENQWQNVLSKLQTFH